MFLHFLEHVHLVRTMRTNSGSYHSHPFATCLIPYSNFSAQPAVEVMTSANEEAEELMRLVEREEEKVKDPSGSECYSVVFLLKSVFFFFSKIPAAV